MVRFLCSTSVAEGIDLLYFNHNMNIYITSIILSSRARPLIAQPGGRMPEARLTKPDSARIQTLILNDSGCKMTISI
ncbi:MAG TPA: hypothetical protein VFY62_11940 [Pseudomonas sp.]|nr:hypothetical protein [Pseudomonas sp.]